MKMTFYRILKMGKIEIMYKIQNLGEQFREFSIFLKILFFINDTECTAI